MAYNETYAEDEITCPYCNYAISDSWDIGDDYGVLECGDCGKKFEWSRDVRVTYSTNGVEGDTTDKAGGQDNG